MGRTFVLKCMGGFDVSDSNPHYNIDLELDLGYLHLDVYIKIKE